MKIIQILTKTSGSTIYGLGDDNNVYTWTSPGWAPDWNDPSKPKQTAKVFIPHHPGNIIGTRPTEYD